MILKVVNIVLCGELLSIYPVTTVTSLLENKLVQKSDETVKQSFSTLVKDKTCACFVLVAVQSLSKQSDLVKAVVKSLAPALMAEMARMKSLPSSSASFAASTSSSSSSKAAKRDLTTKSVKVKSGLQKCRTSSSSKLKVSGCQHENTSVEFVRFNDLLLM